MDTHKKMREHISSLSDGALADADLELALAALQTADGQHAWNTYHRIGDVLRAQATPALSDGFGARLAARLAAEPAPGRRTVRHGGVPATPGAGMGSGQGTAPAHAEAGEAVAAAAKPAIATVS